MTFKKLVFYIALLGIIGLVAYQLMHKPTNLDPLPPIVTIPAPVVTSTANYSCDTGTTIAASYSDQLVQLKLSDGRSFKLAQGQSADGAQYKNDTVTFVTKGDQAYLQEGTSTTYSNCIVDTSAAAVNGTKTFTDQGKTFSFSYPEEFLLAGGGIGYTKTWKANEDGTLGLILATLQSPANFQPSTNLGDAKFTVGTSADPKAVKGCLADTSGQGVTKSVVTIHKVPFTKFVSVDAGAGNRYETNSFRAIQNGQCYTIEYTLHYAVLTNFDPNSGIKAYDAKAVHDTMDGIVNSFAFLPQ